VSSDAFIFMAELADAADLAASSSLSLFFATYRTINEIRRLEGSSRAPSLGRFWSANPRTVVTGQFVEMVKLTVILAWVSTASSP
jgi:hypothetical protein